VQPTPADRRVQIVAGNDAERTVISLLAREGLPEGGYVHIHPASRWKFKCWSAQKNAELIDRLAARGERVVLTAAPDAEEIAMVEDILKRTSASVLNLAGKLSLKELVALIARAKASICVDSMPMHVASALGTRVVALFGPSGEIEWGPWMVENAVVTTNYACRPCGNDGCGGGKVSECLTTLGVDQVFAAAERLLEIP
jgi:heptosyltransferase-3